MGLMIKKLLKQFGYIHTSELVEYIHTSELVERAVGIYINHSKPTKDEKEFYYDCGNCNALNYLLFTFGIDLVDYVKRENIKRDAERRTDD